MKLIKTSLILLLGMTLFLSACKTDEETDSAADKRKIEQSIISLPKSLSNKGEVSSRVNTENRDTLAHAYEGIRGYVGVAEGIKDFVKELILNVVEGVPQLPLGKEIYIWDGTENGVRRIKAEKDANYEWKLSAYITESDPNPELVVRYTITDTGAKGRLLWKINEPNGALKTVGITLNTDTAIDVTFDGTTSTKTLEIKFIQDLAPVFTAFDQGQFSSLTEDQLEDVMGQTAKVFVNAKFDESSQQYSVFGTSYHPGWSKINNEAFGEGRNMYVFKAKGNDNAKLYLAIPLKTRDNTTNMWTEDSISEVFANFMLNNLNDFIAKLNDDVDDAPEDPTNTSDAFYGDKNSEKAAAKWLVNIIRLQSPLLAVTDFTITKAQLLAFVLSPDSGDTGIEEYKASYKSISYMINPAFYNSTVGFMGTYDETNDIYYAYSTATNTMSAGDKPSSFAEINAIDLSGIEPYIPVDVVNATITVE